MSDIYTRKICWKAVAEKVSKLCGRRVASSYCSEVYNGHRTSKKILETILVILENDSQSTEREKGVT